MRKPPRELLEFLSRYDPGVRSLGLALRGIVLQEMAPCHEYIFPMRSKIVLLYGSSEKVLADCVCSIAIFRRHATLVFHRGIDLTDRYGLLRGSGKRLRHLRIEHETDLHRPQLRGYLRQARRLSALGRSRRTTLDDVMTRVKAGLRTGSTRGAALPRMF